MSRQAGAKGQEGRGCIPPPLEPGAKIYRLAPVTQNLTPPFLVQISSGSGILCAKGRQGRARNECIANLSSLICRRGSRKLCDYRLRRFHRKAYRPNY